MNLIVNYATVSDAPSLVVLYHQLFPSREIKERDIVNYINSSINEQQNQRVLVIKLNNIIIGTCQVVIYRNPIRQPLKKGIIDSVVIDESNRNNGFGKYLIRAAISELLKDGCETIAVIVGHHRKEGRRLYESLGFLNYGNCYMTSDAHS